MLVVIPYISVITTYTCPVYVPGDKIWLFTVMVRTDVPFGFIEVGLVVALSHDPPSVVLKLTASVPAVAPQSVRVNWVVVVKVVDGGLMSRHGPLIVRVTVTTGKIVFPLVSLKVKVICPVYVPAVSVVIRGWTFKLVVWLGLREPLVTGFRLSHD